MKRFIPIALALALSACAFDEDPFEKPGTWAATGDNVANLRVMVADPHDLVAGREMDGASGIEAATPVKKLFEGKRDALPTTQASTVYGGGDNGGNNAGGGNGGR